MKMLLTGKDGQLGEELQMLLAPLGEVTAVGRAELDLTNPDAIRRQIQAIAPDIIINAAAYTAVDKAEGERELAYAVNAIAPTVMAEMAQGLGSTLIHVSTDYVFNGQKNTPYREDDPTQPLGIYGTSKLAGEDGIRMQCDRHLILRTAWVYGQGGKGNFVKTMLRLGKERDELRVVMDQVGSPTWTGDLGRAIVQFLEHGKGDRITDIAGTYHVTNSGAISWYDFAIAIFDEATRLGMPLQVQRVLPITTADYPTPARRPAYSVLSQQKTAALLGAPQPHWRQGLRQMLTQLIH